MIELPIATPLNKSIEVTLCTRVVSLNKSIGVSLRILAIRMQSIEFYFTAGSMRTARVSPIANRFESLSPVNQRGDVFR